MNAQEDYNQNPIEDQKSERGYINFLVTRELFEKINVFSRNNYTIELDNALFYGTVWLANDRIGRFSITLEGKLLKMTK